MVLDPQPGGLVGGARDVLLGVSVDTPWALTVPTQKMNSRAYEICNQLFLPQSLEVP